jgi:hypothetical protein
MRGLANSKTKTASADVKVNQANDALEERLDPSPSVRKALRAPGQGLRNRNDKAPLDEIQRSGNLGLFAMRLVQMAQGG